MSGYIDAAEFTVRGKTNPFSRTLWLLNFPDVRFDQIFFLQLLLKDLLRTGSSPVEPVDLSKARDYAEAFVSL